MHLGTGNERLKYYLNQSELAVCEKVRDLGVIYSNKLCFDEYIDSIVSRAYQRIYLIFRSFVTKDVKLLTRAFTTYIRPLLEYCTPVWSPYLIKDIARVENVQRYFTRRLFPRNTTTYENRLTVTNLETLELRRVKFDLKMYYQIIHNQLTLDRTHFFQLLPVHHNTRSHGLQIQKQIYPNNALFNTFSNRAIDFWNGLPSEVALASNLNIFKQRLNKLTPNYFALNSGV
jgi:hypothetical protein